MNHQHEINELKHKLASAREALKPFAEFWRNRASFTSEPEDRQAYVSSPAKAGKGNCGALEAVFVGDFRRALAVYDGSGN